MRFVLLASAAALLTGCGYVGDPLPPALNIPVAIEDLRAVQRGDKLVLDYTAPEVTTEQTGLTSISAATVQVGPDLVEATPPKPGTRASIELPAGQWTGQTVDVYVLLRGPKGQQSGPSNRVALQIMRPLAPPANIKAEPHPEGIRVTWTAVDDRATGYRIQRNPDATAEADKPEYVDRAVEQGKSYSYTVVAVNGKVESLPGAAAEATSRDLFPPAQPSNLNGVVGLAAIELTWDPAAAPDLKSYRVYRDDRLLAPDLQSPVFSDKQIAPSTRYRYAVSAVDQTGNESARSTTVEVVTP